MWQRGKGQLKSKTATLDPRLHEAAVDDLFKMSTTLEYDESDRKYLPRKSVLSIVLDETSEVAATYEFDLGRWATRVANGKTVKSTLNMESEYFPGCQLSIYVNFFLKDKDWT